MKEKLLSVHIPVRRVIGVILGLLLAIALLQTSLLSSILSISEYAVYPAAFIAGFFFTSIFTIAPASAAFVEIGALAQHDIWIAIIGGIGATITDLGIFWFIRKGIDHAAEGHTSFDKFLALFRFGFLKWLAPLVGGIIIASPLPDELAIALFGLAHVPPPVIGTIAVIMNTIGIYVLIALTS